MDLRFSPAEEEFRQELRQFLSTNKNLVKKARNEHDRGIGWGPNTWELAMEMLRQGVRDGITEVICTPHILSRNELDREKEVLELFAELIKRVAAEGLPIKIHIGSELYIQPHLTFEKKISTLAQNGRYFLVEFSMGMIPEYVSKKFFDLLLKHKTPIIAHPERNISIISKHDTAVQLVERGALLQMNAGSLLGVFGKTVKTSATRLMDANLVHFIASDAHDSKSRPLKLREAYDFVKAHWGPERAEKLFYENQVKMMHAEDIKIGESKPPSQTVKRSIRDKIGFLRFK